jgi:hypothetical protein
MTQRLAAYIITTLLQIIRFLDVELNTSTGALETLSVAYLYLSLPKSFDMYTATPCMHNSTIIIIAVRLKSTDVCTDKSPPQLTISKIMQWLAPHIHPSNLHVVEFPKDTPHSSSINIVLQESL